MEHSWKNLVLVLYQLLRTKRFLLGLWNGFKGMELPFEEVEAHTSQSIVYVGIDSTLAGLIYFEDQIRLLDALELSRLTMKQNLDVQSSNPDAIT
ncbi:copper-transporting ATPase PAA1, chloroplastic-like isoform X2 [Pyrus x bretschneideri]|nr:copper-transporting ATPase PAA1, chloroplastic-like isoform X2 [Pyrus x bretschneideri]